MKNSRQISNDNYLNCFNKMYNESMNNGFFVNFTKEFHLNDRTLSVLIDLKLIKRKFNENSTSLYIWKGEIPNTQLVTKVKNLMSELVKNLNNYKHKKITSIPKSFDYITLNKCIAAAKLANDQKIENSQLTKFIKHYVKYN
jgi:hypothetical protein